MAGLQTATLTAALLEQGSLRLIMQLAPALPVHEELINVLRREGLGAAVKACPVLRTSLFLALLEPHPPQHLGPDGVVEDIEVGRVLRNLEECDLCRSLRVAAVS